jgi:ribosome biogenesis protein Tsr3
MILFSRSFRSIYFICMNILAACMYICGMCMPGAWIVQKWSLDFLELEVKCLLDRYHVAAGNQSLFLCKSN